MVEDRRILDMFGDPWPTRITGENRMQMREHRDAGLPPELSAALIIFQHDTASIVDEMQNWVQVSPEEALEKMGQFEFGFYMKPASILLAAEGYRRTQQVHESGLDTLKKAADTPRLFDDPAVEGFIMTEDAETQLLLERILGIWDTEGPLAAYDHAVAYEQQKPYNKDDPGAQRALEQSRKRFHQLYQAAKEE